MPREYLPLDLRHHNNGLAYVITTMVYAFLTASFALFIPVRFQRHYLLRYYILAHPYVIEHDTSV